MKFSEMPYQRPDLDAVAKKIKKLTSIASGSNSNEEVLQSYQQFCTLADNASTAGTIASIRHTVDTRDPFFDTENDYFDKYNPILAEEMLGFYRAVLTSPHRSSLDQAYGKILTEKMEIAVRSSDERLIELQQKENTLTSDYDKLYASAKIPFDGKELTVAQLAPYKQSTNRNLRKDAFIAEGSFFDAHQEELDEIYSHLVQNRTEQAKMLGYQTFTPLGDIRMERHGYSRKDIAACRNEVKKDIVPFAHEIIQAQARRINVAKPMFFDLPLFFSSGNPVPKGTPEEILAAGETMYRSLSPETAEFIDFMMKGELFDVLAKPGKAPGGYCTYIAGYQSPFIFSNFNGTSGDVDVLTHEAGHAFAAYVAAKKNLPLELRSPGLESCEIHSMSMEFLTRKYHHLFFAGDTAKYDLAHTADAILFLPYGCMVDEFQQQVYDQPNLSAKQRNELWLQLESEYRPWIDFGDLPFYARGAGWQRQLHIFTSPFYYIDYVLAQTIALEFFLAAEKDPKDAWDRYLALVQKAGTETYPGLVAAAGFNPPYEPGVLHNISNNINQWMLKHPLN